MNINLKNPVIFILVHLVIFIITGALANALASILRISPSVASIGTILLSSNFIGSYYGKKYGSPLKTTFLNTVSVGLSGIITLFSLIYYRILMIRGEVDSNVDVIELGIASVLTFLMFSFIISFAIKFGIKAGIKSIQNA
ncbi:MAG: hypothetical protein Q9M91_02430 [Candidatus Dojkabacteria bacterium]|nr:hypothetical protein [Candidatus Dojkabacteria bacterium]MDQ7020682.1 hypothetical protein [Candidatus Dojkabacteria bacterium]